MRILVHCLTFDIGGIQRNAIDLSIILRDTFGHDVIIFAPPGPMVKVAESAGIRFIPAPRPDGVLSRKVMRALREVVEIERPDMVHVWDYAGWQCVNVFYALHLAAGLPMIVTDMMSDHLVRIVPRCITTTFGTPAFVDEARAAGHRHAELLLPPVDVNENAPGTVSSQALRKIYQIGPSEVVLVTVSRLVSELKGDSLRGTIEAVRILGRDLPIRLILVGDGNLKLELENQAAKVNAELGRSAVILAGAMVDPRPAYAAADICIGMGGSALRGMAFGKPTIIVGSAGFAAPFTPATATSFYYGGIYGIGENVHGAEQLVEHIRALIVNGSELATLGEFSRQFVVRHFSLDAVSVNLERQCRAAAKSNWLAAAGEALRLALILAYPRVVPSRLRQQLKRVIQFGGAASGVLRWGSKPARVDLGECHRDDTNRDRTS